MINFKFKERKTNAKTEINAGVVTFITMAYILFVNAGILSQAGMPFQGILIATALATGISTILMGVLTNTPIALAPGMGLNAFFTFGVVMGMGFSWEQALSIVLVSGLMFIILTIFNIRKLLIDNIPQDIKKAIPVGIGGFIAFIGLKNAGIIVDSPATLVQLGNLTDVGVAIPLIFIITVFVLHVKKVKGSILISMILAAIVGLIVKKLGIPTVNFSKLPTIPTKFVSTDFSGFTTILGVAWKNVFWVFTSPKALIAVAIFMFVDIFDTVGTMIPILSEIKKVDKQVVKSDKKILSVDAASTIIGATLGTATVTTFIESLSGVEEGGRTGLTAIVTGILFLLTVFISPITSLFSPIVTSVALVYVGSLMFSHIALINWKSNAASFSTFVLIIGMILSFSIYWGIVAAFITYPIIKYVDKNEPQVKKSEIVLLLLAISFIMFYYL